MKFHWKKDRKPLVQVADDAYVHPETVLCVETRYAPDPESSWRVLEDTPIGTRIITSIYDSGHCILSGWPTERVMAALR